MKGKVFNWLRLIAVNLSIAALCFAGPLATAASRISVEITQAVTAIVGVIVVVYTLMHLGRREGLFLAAVELGVVLILLENAQSIGQFFTFTG